MENSPKRKGQAVLEWLMTYGWAILVVLTAVAALAYFGVFTGKPALPQDNTVYYDCGNLFVRGQEYTTGELLNASFALKTNPAQTTNDVVFGGRFLKAYYDMETCVQTNAPSTNNTTGQ